MSDDTQVLYLVLLVACLLISAFFSSSETAFISLQRFRLQHLVDTKVKGSGLVAKLVEKPEKLLSTILLGNNFVNVAAAALATALAVDLWGDNGVWIATLALTIALLIFSETTPKTLATQHAEKLSFFYARPIQIIAWLLTPFVAVLSWLATVLSRLFGGGSLNRSLVSEEEIRSMITFGHKEGVMEEDEAEMLHAVFEFGDRPVGEIIVPRPEIVGGREGHFLRRFLGNVRGFAHIPFSRLRREYG